MQRKRRGRSEGSIYQRADGVWTASISLGYDDVGKRKRRVVYGESKREVQEKLRDLQNNAADGQLPEVGKLTVGQHLRSWLAVIKPTVANHTHLCYDQHCKLYLLPHLGGVRLSRLTALHVQNLYADLSRAGVSAAMRKKAGTTLGVALQNAVDLGLLPHNVARDVKKPKHTPKEMQVLGPDQVQVFLEESKKDRLHALYVFLLDSGAREGEAFGLKWQDTDWKGDAVQLVRELEEYKGRLSLKELKTKKSRRRLPLSRFTMDALTEHRKAALAAGVYQADGTVFCDTEGGWLRKSNVLRRSFRPILKRAKLPAIRRVRPANRVPSADTGWTAKVAGSSSAGGRGSSTEQAQRRGAAMDSLCQ
ncbi:MAG: tyrosine-type recombinase/integrase family protein, partial [Planctomycetia bacterium]|nr:tyrosine-type recombinase/integrase family protein [Planctomycetia bacterium]